jgi:hypothetical protein
MPLGHAAAMRAAVLILVCISLWPHSTLAQFTQQGPKLVGTGAIDSGQGWSVALSYDGNTAVVGRLNDRNAPSTDLHIQQPTGWWVG